MKKQMEFIAAYNTRVEERSFSEKLNGLMPGAEYPMKEFLSFPVSDDGTTVLDTMPSGGKEREYVEYAGSKIFLEWFAKNLTEKPGQIINADKGIIHRCVLTAAQDLTALPVGEYVAELAKGPVKDYPTKFIVSTKLPAAITCGQVLTGGSPHSIVERYKEYFGDGTDISLLPPETYIPHVVKRVNGVTGKSFFAPVNRVAIIKFQ